MIIPTWQEIERVRDYKQRGILGHGGWELWQSPGRNGKYHLILGCKARCRWWWPNPGWRVVPEGGFITCPNCLRSVRGYYVNPRGGLEGEMTIRGRADARRFLSLHNPSVPANPIDVDDYLSRPSRLARSWRPPGWNPTWDEDEDEGSDHGS